jgi:kumamolisin
MAQIPSTHRALAKTERKPIPGAKKIGPADPDEKLTVSIRVRRRHDAPAMPGLRDYAPNAPRQRFTREELAAKFGASPQDLERVAQFGEEYGLKVVESSIARRTVVLSGTVAQMNRAFAVDLGRYESPRGPYRGREGAVNLPKELDGVVQGVFGLDNRQMARRMSGKGPYSLAPRQIAELYQFPLSISAEGQTIGLFEFGGGYKTSDIETYFSSQGLEMPALTFVPKDGVTNLPGSSSLFDEEVAADIEVAGAVAQGAAIVVYFAPWTEQGWLDLVTTAIMGEDLPPDWKAPDVISISYGWSELETVNDLAWTQAAVDAISETFQEAAMLGTTVFIASGDDGSSAETKDGRAHVNYPATDPWVTCCGGTTITNINEDSFTELTWNEGGKHDGITGGGVSDLFDVPYWQKWANVPVSVNNGHSGRGIPDIAGYADGYKIYVDGHWKSGVSGTSEAAPLYAGLMALVNAAIADSVGYINPILYNLSYDRVFRDIADGGSNASNGAPGYTSIPGWDACTGWGSVDGSALLNAIETALFTMILPTLV